MACAGAQHIKAVQRGFLLDAFGVAFESEAIIADGQLEMFGHFALVKHSADSEADLVLATEPRGLEKTAWPAIA